jgi:hypothetical protein
MNYLRFRITEMVSVVWGIFIIISFSVSARVVREGSLLLWKREALEKISRQLDFRKVNTETSLYDLIRSIGECKRLSGSGKTFSYAELAEKMKEIAEKPDTATSLINPLLDSPIHTPWGDYRLTDLNNILCFGDHDAIMKISFLLEIAQAVGEINIEGFQFHKSINTRKVYTYLKEFFKNNNIKISNIHLSLSNWAVFRYFLVSEVLTNPENYRRDYKQYEFIKRLVEEGRVKNTNLEMYFTAINESEKKELGWHSIDLTLNDIEENLEIVTTNSVTNVVKALLEEDVEPTRDKVAEKLSVSVDVLAGLSWINNIDLVYLGVKGRAKLTEQGIKDAVVKLTKLGKRPTRANVAAELGVSYTTLCVWARQNNYDLEKDLGLVSYLISEEAIKDTVAKLREVGELPTLTNVCAEMGVSSTGLYDWVERHKINLATLGIVKKKLLITEEKIKDAIRYLTELNIPPFINNVADQMEVRADSLRDWANKNGIDLRSLGIDRQISLPITLERIERAIEILEAEEIKANIKNVAWILKCAPESIKTWAWRTGNNLEEIGLVETKITKERIKDAVAFVKSMNMVPTRARVADALGVKYKSLISWFSRKGEDETKYGIVDVAKEAEYLIEQLKDKVSQWGVTEKEKIALTTILEEYPVKEVETFLNSTGIIGFKTLILSERPLPSLVDIAKSSGVPWIEISKNYLAIREKSKIVSDILALMEFENLKYQEKFPQKEDLERLSSRIQSGFQEINDTIASLITYPKVSESIKNSQVQLLELFDNVFAFKNKEFTRPSKLEFPTYYSDLGITIYPFNNYTTHIELKLPTNDDRGLYFYFGINYTGGMSGHHRQYIKLNIADNGLELKVYTEAIYRLLVFLSPSLNELSVQIFPFGDNWSNSNNFKEFLKLFQGYIKVLYPRATEINP